MVWPCPREARCLGWLSVSCSHAQPGSPPAPLTQTLAPYSTYFRAYSRWQAATFAADAFFRAALAYKAEEKIGLELARLKQAIGKLQEVRRAKPPPCPALEAMSALEALVLVEQNIATKDNQCVYMEQVRSKPMPSL
jgi:hypothetical protein